MPLDEREQRILDDIAQQFREEDPDLVRAASTMPLAGFARRHVKLAAAGTVIGLAIMLGTFLINVLIGLVGFVIMVVSATALAAGMAGGSRAIPDDELEILGDSRKSRWPFRR